VSGGEFETNQQEQIDNLNLISAARNLFHREIDRSLFDVLLAAHSFDRAERDTASLRIPNFCSGAEQYFEFGTPSFGSIIVEGGVFDGRDSCVYLGHIGDVGKIYGFEPFPELVTQGPYWHKLSNTENFKLTPLALWDSCMDLLFTSGGSVGSGSGISAVAEGRVVSATSLDNFAARESLTRVDIIKLDIEGAEMNALNGARRIIRRDHPTLAISLYHHRTHLYLLPLLIHSMYSGYRFYIGQYTGMFVDTVLYAVGN
jgi:FkbM family methyltransferase